MTDPTYKYIEEHSLAEAPGLDWIRRQTNLRTNYARMMSGPLQGTIITMLTKLCGVRNALEIGTFTGYTSVCIANGLAEGGHLDTLEKNDELEDIIREGWERCGVSDKITLHFGCALDFLAQMAAHADTGSTAGMGSMAGMGGTAGTADAGGTGDTGEDLTSEACCENSIEGKWQPYDLVYIDADKREYRQYFEAVLPLVRHGGLIMADNTLWDGKVLEDPLPVDHQTQEIYAFNNLVASDPRIETVILPLRDGLSLIRRK